MSNCLQQEYQPAEWVSSHFKMTFTTPHESPKFERTGRNVIPGMITNQLNCSLAHLRNSLIDIAELQLFLKNSFYQQTENGKSGTKYHSKQSYNPARCAKEHESTDMRQLGKIIEPGLSFGFL